MYNVIHWTDIYPVDSVIQPLNYWGLQVIFSFTSLLEGALIELKLYCHYIISPGFLCSFLLIGLIMQHAFYDNRDYSSRGLNKGCKEDNLSARSDDNKKKSINFFIYIPFDFLLYLILRWLTSVKQQSLM